MRVPITHVCRGSDGTPRPDADVYVYDRGTTTQADCYTASSGGSVLTQPLTPGASGVIPAYVSEPGPYDIVEVYNGVPLKYPFEAVLAVTDTWIAPTLTNSWVNYAGGYDTAGYKRTNSGFVVCKGLIKSGTVVSSAFNLPAGFRPSESAVYCRGMQNGTVSTITINTNGNVVPNGASNLWATLAMIRFPAAA